MIKLDRERIKKDVLKLNEIFPYRNIKGKEGVKIRTQVSVNDFGLSDVRFLNKNFECIVPVFYSKGEHAYRLYAPLDFINYLELNYRSYEKELEDFFKAETFFQ